MFRCGLTGDLVPPGVKPVLVTLKKRKRIYAAREGVNRVASWKEEKSDKIRSSNDVGGQGWEIEKEVLASPKAAQDWQKKLEAGTVEVQWGKTKTPPAAFENFESKRPTGWQLKQRRRALRPASNS